MKKIVQGFFFLISPFLIFVLMEAFEHNPFIEIRQEAFAFNVLLFELLALILLGLLGSAKWSLMMLLLASFVYGVVNHYVMLFRSTPFVPWDIFSIKTAGSVAGNYDFTPDVRMLLVIFGYLALGIGICFLKFEMHGKKRFAGIGMAAVACLVLSLFTGSLQNGEFQTKHHLYPFLFTPAYMTKVNGMGVTFAMNLAYMKVEKPDGYHKSTEKEFLLSYEKKDVEMDFTPNIVVIMDEAFSDLAVLGEVGASEDYMPFVHRLMAGEENTVSGFLNVSVCGGNTANTEYEFLTGNTMRFLPAGSIPYQQYINKEVPSLASYLKSLGYRTTAMHPYYANGWKRNVVYPRLGFEQTYFLEDMEHPSYIRKYVSDQWNFEKIKELLRENADAPIFLFNVTMQNHGSYTDTYKNFHENIVATDKDNSSLNQYLSLLRKTDEAFEDFIRYLEDQEEPYIVLFFGDHQPNNAIARSFTYKEDSLRYQVPYVIWANFAIEGETQVDTSANYLAMHLCEKAGIPLHAYQSFLKKTEESYPILSAVRLEEKGDLGEKWMKEYQKMQYYLMFDWEGDENEN